MQAKYLSPFKSHLKILCFQVTLYIRIFLTGIGNTLLAQEKTETEIFCEVWGSRLTYFINCQNGFVEPCKYLLPRVWANCGFLFFQQAYTAKMYDKYGSSLQQLFQF